MTDTGGNTFYIATLNNAKGDVFLRKIENKDNAQKFEILFDLVNSSGDYNKSEKVLEKLLKIKKDLNDLDRAKFLLLELEINFNLHNTKNDEELKILINSNNNDDWDKIKQKYNEIYN